MITSTSASPAGLMGSMMLAIDHGTATLENCHGQPIATLRAAGGDFVFWRGNTHVSKEFMYQRGYDVRARLAWKLAIAELNAIVKHW